MRTSLTSQGFRAAQKSEHLRRNLLRPVNEQVVGRRWYPLHPDIRAVSPELLHLFLSFPCNSLCAGAQSTLLRSREPASPVDVQILGDQQKGRLKNDAFEISPLLNVADKASLPVCPLGTVADIAIGSDLRLLAELACQCR